MTGEMEDGGLGALAPVVLDRDARVPLAVQLADAVRTAAGQGALHVGDRVPSTRALAVELGVSRTVTTAAYEQLVTEGWLGSRRGSGTYMLAVPEQTPSPVWSAIDAGSLPPSTCPPDGSDTPRCPLDGPGVDLRAGSPCLEVLDRAAWRRAWRHAGDYDPLGRPEYAGVAAFRQTVTELLRNRGIDRAGASVMATAGTTDGFAEVIRALRRDRHVRVAVEEPGYLRAVAVLRAAGAEIVGVPVDGDGLVVEKLPAGLDAVFCTPAHQFPLGGRMPVARRVALIERARAEGFLVIEDDYDGELRYDVAPLPVLAALGPDVVVYLGTTSKIVSPTLGVGWMLAPPAVRDTLLDQRRATSLRPSPAGQLVLAALELDGVLARHLARLRRELAARRADVVAAVTRAGHAVAGDRAGAHLVVPLPNRATENTVVATARAVGLTLEGLSEFHLGRPRHHGLLVGWAAPPRAALTSALERLTAVLREVPPGPGDPSSNATRTRSARRAKA